MMSASARRALMLALVLAPLALPQGCAAGSPASVGASAPAYKSPLSNLVSAEDQTAQASLEKVVSLTFPVNVGIAYYEYETALKPEDEQKVIADFKTALDAAGIANDTLLIPTSLLKGGNSMESLRQLGARFKCDVLLLVSGTTTQDKADDQPTNIFDGWGGRAYWEARTTLVAVSMDVRTGTYLSPYQAVGVRGPSLMATNSSAFYKLGQEAEVAAWTKLRGDVVASIDKLQKKFAPPAAAPTAAPTGVPTSAPAPTVAPTASPTAAPAATASPEATTAPTPSATASAS